MTCVIGMYYDHGKGAIVIADSRTMIGADYSRDRKPLDIDGEVIFAGARKTAMFEKLIPNVKRTRIRSRRFLPSETVDVFEDEMAELHHRYKYERPYRSPADETPLMAIIGVVDGDEPILHCLHENGYAERIRDFRVIGHGARHANNILRTVYSPEISQASRPFTRSDGDPSMLMPPKKAI